MVTTAYDSLTQSSAFWDVLILSALVVYIVPTVVGVVRRPANGWALLALIGCNILFGWTVIGWFAALVFAFTLPSQREKSTVRPAMAPGPGWRFGLGPRDKTQ
jgi:hypothetical protein